MPVRRALPIVVLFSMLTSVAQGGLIVIRTGQVGGVPGVCSGADDSFHWYAPQPLCSYPILAVPFQPAHFDGACAGPPAVVVDAEPYSWTPTLPCDPDARWIASDIISGPGGNCFGKRQSVLYCAEFSSASHCTMADSIVVCWAVDDYLGDPPAFPGPNPGGVYVNGVDLGPAFSGLGASTARTAVAYNVPLNLGPNRLQIYQRDAGCGVAGLILSARIYTCEPVSVEPRSWGEIKLIQR